MIPKTRREAEKKIDAALDPCRLKLEAARYALPDSSAYQDALDRALYAPGDAAKEAETVIARRYP